jgi:DNA-binding transcriptional regulator GbsR (MarR family)
MFGFVLHGRKINNFEENIKKSSFVGNKKKGEKRKYYEVNKAKFMTDIQIVKRNWENKFLDFVTGLNKK